MIKNLLKKVLWGMLPLADSENELTASYPDISWKPGARLNGMTNADLNSWYDSLFSK
ncbi:MAG: hypothetical protein J6T88_03880 [Bacteroidales bacterium]|nr:hypothetical protein [Bacteroidales bacterium]